MRHWVGILKIAISLAILFFLFHSLRGQEGIEDLWRQPKRWHFLFFAAVCCLAAVLNTFVRWFFLVRALDVPLRLADAIRLGFVGYLFNFVSLGAVGGDLFKALALARERPRHRPQAVASVAVDRALGLLSLLVVAAVAILLGGPTAPDQPQLKLLFQATVGITFAGLVALTGIFFVPPRTTRRWLAVLWRFPLGGRVLSKLVGSLSLYQRNPPLVVVAMLMSAVTHLLFVLAFYCMGRGLYDPMASLADHVVIVPLSMVAGALPLPLGALGAFEAVLGTLYQYVPLDVSISALQGVMIALCYRVICVGIAAGGMATWFTRRKEISNVVHEAERLSEAASPDAPAREQPTPSATQEPVSLSRT